MVTNSLLSDYATFCCSATSAELPKWTGGTWKCSGIPSSVQGHNSVVSDAKICYKTNVNNYDYQKSLWTTHTTYIIRQHHNIHPNDLTNIQKHNWSERMLRPDTLSTDVLDTKQTCTLRHKPYTCDNFRNQKLKCHSF